MSVRAAAVQSFACAILRCSLVDEIESVTSPSAHPPAILYLSIYLFLIFPISFSLFLNSFLLSPFFCSGYFSLSLSVFLYLFVLLTFHFLSFSILFFETKYFFYVPQLSLLFFLLSLFLSFSLLYIFFTLLSFVRSLSLFLYLYFKQIFNKRHLTRDLIPYFQEVLTNFIR